MTPIGIPELVLVLVALGGMTAAAIWGAIELTIPGGGAAGSHRGNRPDKIAPVQDSSVTRA
jgi:hypothetical protein